MLPRITGEFTVGSDPELRFAPSGIAVASFSAVADKSSAVGNRLHLASNDWRRENGADLTGASSAGLDAQVAALYGDNVPEDQGSRGWPPLFLTFKPISGTRIEQPY